MISISSTGTEKNTVVTALLLCKNVNESVTNFTYKGESQLCELTSYELSLV